MPIKQEFFSTNSVPIKIWTHDVDANSLKQLRNTASLPCMFHHVAAMPDVHFGIGATVGSVIATKKAVIPAAVGVDIGCGMMAARLPFSASQLPDSLKDLRSEIEWSIPVGFNWHTEPTPEAIKWFGSEDNLPLAPMAREKFQKMLCQLGTLGGGNHFVEICLDTQQCVWIMLHSGSRGIGNDIAKVHIQTAKGLFGESLKNLADPDLAYLAEGTPEFANYWRDLQWAQAYAFKNREIMMTRTLRAVAKILLGIMEKKSSSRVRVLYAPDLAITESFQALWEHARLLFGDEVVLKPSIRVPTGLDARCRELRRRNNSRRLISFEKQRGSNAGKTQESLMKFPVRISRSTR